ncbi:DUF2254 family protein [Streptomyces sp. NPDC040724]|uniref:DUF2254 family protein n=1 Tax=unclassified Streptomyces TaxID=2593676 RepID=UPI0033F4864B
MFQPPTRAMRRDLTQLICALGGLALGLVAPMADVKPLVEAARVATMLFTVGFGVISLVSIIYSMLFLVVQFSASTFTPRLAFFRDEPIVWRAFAFAVGVFVFCVVSGLAIGARDQVSALLPCVAMILTLVALALMRSLQTKAFDSIQLAHSLTAIATRAHRSYDGLYVRPYDPGRAAAAPPAPPPGTGPAETGPAGTGTRSTVRWSGPATVIQQIDVPALVAVAQRHDCTIDFRVTPGRTLSRGMTLAEVTGAELPEEVLREAVVTGVERTFDQDPELPFRLLADIALRALSPAVNDPATAVESMDRLEDLLTRLADRELDFGRFPDGTGRVRVTVPVPDWEQYVRTACDDIAVAAAASPMALRRLRDLLGRLLERIPEARRPVVRERLAWAERTGSAAYPLIWTPREEYA